MTKKSKIKILLLKLTSNAFYMLFNNLNKKKKDLWEYENMNLKIKLKIKKNLESFKNFNDNNPTFDVNY